MATRHNRKQKLTRYQFQKYANQVGKTTDGAIDCQSLRAAIRKAQAFEMSRGTFFTHLTLIVLQSLWAICLYSGAHGIQRGYAFHIFQMNIQNDERLVFNNIYFQPTATRPNHFMHAEFLKKLLNNM